MTATPQSFDFTDVKDRGEWNKKRQTEGDYRGRVTAVADTKSGEDNVPMWVFTIEVGRGTYPYYCKHQANQYWKLRNLLIAAGMSVPKKKMKVDPNKVVGKEIGVSLEDAEYNGRPQSDVGGVIPLSELDADDLADDDSDDDDDDAEEAPPAKKSKPKPAQDEEDEDEDAEEAEEEESDSGDQFDAMDRAQLKQHISKNNLDVKVFKSMDDDAIREAIRAASSSEDDDDLEEIDIDDA